MNMDRALQALQDGNFGAYLLDDVHVANNNLRGYGEAPWEIVAIYLIALENRVKELEEKLGEKK